MSKASLSAGDDTQEPVPTVLRDLFGIFGDEIAKRMPELILSDQRLTRFPETVLRCTALQHLNLARNKLSQLPGDRMLAALPNLQQLDLSDNLFEDLESGLCVDILGSLPKLSSLDLRRNPLPAINHRLELIVLLIFDSCVPPGPKSAWLPAAQSVVKQSRGLIKKVIKDPKVLVSERLDANRALDSGPISTAKRLSDYVGRPVHFCDMNLAAVPRTAGRFNHLTKLNGVPVTVEDLDASVDQLNNNTWYTKYPRIQCQKHLRCATVEDPEIVLAKHHKREKRQADAEVRRFNSRLNHNKGKSKAEGKQSKASNLRQRLASKREKALRDAATAKQDSIESRTKSRVQALIRYGHIDGGEEAHVDRAWVKVRMPTEEGSDEEYTNEEADQLLQRLKFKSLAREQNPTDYSAPVQQHEESMEEGEVEGEGQSMLFLTKDPSDLTIGEAAKRELADSRALLKNYAAACAARGERIEDLPEVFLPDNCGLTFEDYLPLIAAIDAPDEPNLNNQAASKRLANMRQAVQGRIRKGWDKHPGTLHDLIVRLFQKQQIANDETLEQLERQLEAYHIEDPRAFSWEAEVAFKTKVEVKREEHDLKAECDLRFQVKPVNLSKQLESCHLEGRKSLTMADNTRMVEAEKSKIRYEQHRERVQAIKVGAPPPVTLEEQPLTLSPARKKAQPVQKPVDAPASHRAIATLPMHDNGWSIQSVPKAKGSINQEKSYTDLLESAMDIRKTIVDDIRTVQYKTTNFKAAAREVDEKLDNSFYMMDQYYARKNTSLEDQTLKIGDTDFSFADEFRTVGEDAARTRQDLLAALKPL